MTEAPEDHRPIIPSARRRLIGAAGWVTGGQVLLKVLSLGSSLILTRLLMPEVYGLMEIVYIFHVGLHMFSDLGIDQSIVHSKRGDDVRFLNTAWTLQVLRGLLLFTVACAAAYPISVAYGHEEVALLLPAVGLTAVCDGFLSMTVKRYARHLRLGPMVWLEVSLQVIVIVVQVAVAAVWPSPWALVFGAWSGALGKVLLSHILLERHPHRFVWDQSAVNEMLSFGSWIFASTALTFFSFNGDRLLLGAFVPMSELGVYAVATRLRDALAAFQGQLARAVFYPFLAERKRSLEESGGAANAELATLFYRIRLRTDFFFMTASGVLLVFGGTLVDLLYTDAYRAAGQILQVFSLQLAFMIVATSAESVLVAVGNTKQFFLQTLARTVMMGVGIPLGYSLAGYWGVVWATALSEIPALFVVWHAKAQAGVLRPWKEARALLFFGAGIAIGFALDAAASWIVRS